MRQPPPGQGKGGKLVSMNLPARVHAVLAVQLSVGVAFATMPPSLAGESAPDLVTTDTPQYCLQLLDRVSEMVRSRANLPDEVTTLSTQGQRMCDQGQTRGGIMRLRRALVLLQQDTGR
jgi:hypothetical protein